MAVAPWALLWLAGSAAGVCWSCPGAGSGAGLADVTSAHGLIQGREMFKERALVVVQ
ncbi:MAG: hypothetical protein OXC07_07845 [Kistimonas sp.]|nr:hypothetical protein [Kistimonas sp.]